MLKTGTDVKSKIRASEKRLTENAGEAVAAVLRTCIQCGAEIVEGNDGLYHDNKPDLSQYCYADPVAGSRLHDPMPEVQLTAEQLAQYKYNELRKSGKTHWEALGLIYGEIDP